MRKTVYILITLLVAACQTEYTRVLKSDNLDEQYEAAKKYYNDKQYTKALPLFDELISEMRLTGDRRLEEVYFFYAYCWSGTGDFATAAFHFGIFKDTYTKSARREESWYMYAYCKYALTYPVELDQTSTKTAINELQLFINQYPTSERVTKCNEYIDELRDRLKQKALNQALLYYDIGDYKAAITAMRNVINDYPGIKEKEELRYYILKSHFLYAFNSIESKQLERYEETVEEYNKFIKAFPESAYKSKAEDIKVKAEKAIEAIKAKAEEDSEDDDKDGDEKEGEKDKTPDTKQW